MGFVSGSVVFFPSLSARGETTPAVFTTRGSGSPLSEIGLARNMEVGSAGLFIIRRVLVCAHCSY
jgi:hypothetical protein